MTDIDRTKLRLMEVAGCLFPYGLSSEVIQESVTYQPREGDLFVDAYPKCDTAWTQHIVHLIYSNGAPVADMGELFLRSPFLELIGKESAEDMLRPGSIKTHLPYRLIPYSDKAKYLYIARNPKDTVISYFHHATNDPVFLFQEGTFETFFEHFINGYMAFGDYFDHVLEWYEHRNKPNVMILTCEELKRDTKKAVLKIAKFIGEEWFLKLEDDEEYMEKIIQYSSVEYMNSISDIAVRGRNDEKFKDKSKMYPGLKHFTEFVRKHHYVSGKNYAMMRKGLVGKWQDVLSKDQIDRLNKKTEEKLKDTDLYSYWKSINCI